MTESLSEGIQLIVLGVCFALALMRALRMRNSAWTEVACFFACMFLGNVYWYGYLAIFGNTPTVSYISDLSWIAGYVFLLMLLLECNQQRGLAPPVRVAWIPVAVCAVCCVYYIWASGDILLNLSESALVAAIGYFAVRGLAARPEEGQEKGFAHNRLLHASALALVIAEQSLWLLSLLDPTAELVIYSSANFLLTFSCIAILASAWRSDQL